MHLLGHPSTYHIHRTHRHRLGTCPLDLTGRPAEPKTPFNSTLRPQSRTHLKCRTIPKSQSPPTRLLLSTSIADLRTQTTCLRPHQVLPSVSRTNQRPIPLCTHDLALEAESQAAPLSYRVTAPMSNSKRRSTMMVTPEP